MVFYLFARYILTQGIFPNNLIKGLDALYPVQSLYIS